MDPEIAHLEDLLDLFRKIDALTRSSVGLREQVDRQIVAARKREAAANGRATGPGGKVVKLEKRRRK